MTYVPPALAVIGAVLGLWGAYRNPTLLVGANGFGWLGLLTAAFALQFGPEVGLAIAPVPAGIAMAGSAALVLTPVTTSSRSVRTIAATIAALVAVGGAVGAVAFDLQTAEAPWPSGAVLVGAHWATLGAAIAAALIGAGLQIRTLFSGEDDRDAEESDVPGVAEVAAAHGRDHSAKAVALVWLAWTIATLVHWRYLGAPGLGSRSEWFGLGIGCLMTGGLLVGWRLGGGKIARLQRIVAAVWVAAVLVAGVWLSFGFGSPLQLTLGS